MTTKQSGEGLSHCEECGGDNDPRTICSCPTKQRVILEGYMTNGALKEARSEKYGYTTVHKKRFNGAIKVKIVEAE